MLENREAVPSRFYYKYAVCILNDTVMIRVP